MVEGDEGDGGDVPIVSIWLALPYAFASLLCIFAWLRIFAFNTSLFAYFSNYNRACMVNNSSNEISNSIAYITPANLIAAEKE